MDEVLYFFRLKELNVDFTTSTNCIRVILRIIHYMLMVLEHLNPFLPHRLISLKQIEMDGEIGIYYYLVQKNGYWLTTGEHKQNKM